MKKKNSGKELLQKLGTLMALALLINLAASLTGRYFKKRRSL